jgi:hypothetical protein
MHYTTISKSAPYRYLSILLMSLLISGFLTDGRTFQNKNNISNTPSLSTGTVEDLITKASNEKVSHFPEAVITGYRPYAVDSIQVDGKWSLITLGSYPLEMDPDIEVIAPNVLFAIGKLDQSGVWNVYVEKYEDTFYMLLPQLPTNLLSDEAKAILSQQSTASNLSSNSILGLPWALNAAWRYNQGPHDAAEALDFGTPTVGVASTVYSADTGVVFYRNQTCIAIRRSDNVELWYQHIEPTDVSKWPNGAVMSYTAPIGKTTVQSGCGGYSTGHHVHFFLRNNGQNVDIHQWSINDFKLSDKFLYRGNTVVQPDQKQTVLHILTDPSKTALLTLNLGSSCKKRSVTIEVRRTSTIFDNLLGPVFTGSTVSDLNGNITNFALTGVPYGNYYLLIKPQGYLRKKALVNLYPGNNIQDLRCFYVIKGGDINENNKVDIFDYNYLVTDFNTSNSRSDLNGDGIVNLLDYNTIISGFGQYGESGSLLSSNQTIQAGALDSPPGELTLNLSQALAPLEIQNSQLQTGETFNLKVDFDTATRSMAGADAIIAYDPCVIEPLTDQIVESGIFTTTATNSQSAGALEIQAHIWSGVNPDLPISGTGNIVTIPFKVISGLPSTTSLAIRFQPGNTYFSNMDEDSTIQPFLGNVTNTEFAPVGEPQRPSRSAELISPASNARINENYVLLQAQVSDSCGGTFQVIFYAYYNDQWNIVGIDDDGSDGWQIYWDATQVPDQLIKLKAFAGDLAGNGVETAINENINLDRNSPQVETVVAMDPNPTTASNVNFGVVFSKPVTGVNTNPPFDDFALTASGITGSAITSVTGSGATYIVSVYAGIGSGAIHLDVIDDGSISDDVGHPLGGEGSGNGSFTAGDTYNVITNTIIHIGGAEQARHYVPFQDHLRQTYIGANNGPVDIENTAELSTITSQRVIYGGWSYSEMMGLPFEQLSKEYLFPYYNNVAMDSQLRVSNVGGADTTITVYLGTQPIDSYTLAAGGATRKNYTGKNSGPLWVTSSASDILATIRVLYGGSSYSEMMGLPVEQLAKEFIFPYYNNVAMDSQLRVSNVGGASTTIKVYLGSSTTPIDSYTLAAGGATRKNYTGKNSGPLRVTSSASNILTTIRVLYNKNSYSELMGFPTGQLGQEYWYPVYDNVAVDSQLRVSNVGSATTHITVYAGTEQIDSYDLGKGAATRKNYPKNTGPLQVVSSTQPILTTIRMLYAGNSYYEMTGLPHSQLSTQYFFPWYNNKAMDSELRFAVP